MQRKRLLAVVVVLSFLIMEIVLSEVALAISGPGPPSIFIASEPTSQAVQAGDTVIFKVSVYPQSDWKTGNVTLSLLNPPPQWITATFSPGTVTNVSYDGFTSNLEVKVAPDAPQQTNVKLTILGTGVANPHYPPNGPPIVVKLDAETDVTLNIIAPSAKTTVTTTVITTTTTTLTMETIQTQTVTATQIGTSTNTLATTLTTTIITTIAEQASNTPNSAWALSAGVATIVLAAVLITQRRSR